MCRLYIASMKFRLFYHLKLQRVKWAGSPKKRVKFRLHEAIFHNVRTGRCALLPPAGGGVRAFERLPPLGEAVGGAD